VSEDTLFRWSFWISLASVTHAGLATTFEAFLSDIAQVECLRPHTVRAYRYELAAAATMPVFIAPWMSIALRISTPG
jgi:hypothetical protein